MLFRALAVAILPLAAEAVNIVQSNDDGWAEKDIREFYLSLTDAGLDSIISAPAEDWSGSGSLDVDPSPVGSSGCEFKSCPANSPPTGKNASMPEFNYVNSFPVTSMKYGIQKLSPKFFGGPPDIAVAGPNVGSNAGIVTQISGTVGAACEAAKEGVPAIAFSGTTGEKVAWNTPVQDYQTVYADLSTTITQALVNSGSPYLPNDIWLNVNFPAVTSSSCSSPSDFKFVLSRIHTPIPFLTPDDVRTCHNGARLPAENAVLDTNGCYVSISVGVADTKLTASAKQQGVVLKKLRSILSCLPK